MSSSCAGLTGCLVYPSCFGGAWGRRSRSPPGPPQRHQCPVGVRVWLLRVDSRALLSSLPGRSWRLRFSSPPPSVHSQLPPPFAPPAWRGEFAPRPGRGVGAGSEAQEGLGGGGLVRLLGMCPHTQASLFPLFPEGLSRVAWQACSRRPVAVRAEKPPLRLNSATRFPNTSCATIDLAKSPK